MAINKASPVISMKDSRIEDESCFINFSNLKLQTQMRTMTTPTSLTTPTFPISEPNTLAPGFTEKYITNEYTDKVLEFLRKNFFVDEPLNIAVELIDDKNERCKELEEYCLETMSKGLSTMVLNSEGNIVAAGLYGVCNKDDVEEDHSESCKNPRFRKILKFLHKIGTESDFFAKCPDLDSILDIKIISVDSSCRGQGLGHYLLHKAIEIAKSINIKAIRSECSSVFTAKIMKKLGSVKIYELMYDDYTDDNGKPIFNTPPPHDKVTIYYYRF